MEYLISFLVFFMAYFCLNLLVNKFRKRNKKNTIEVLKNSVFIAVVYILVIFIYARLR